MSHNPLQNPIHKPSHAIPRGGGDRSVLSYLGRVSQQEGAPRPRVFMSAGCPADCWVESVWGCKPPVLQPVNIVGARMTFMG